MYAKLAIVALFFSSWNTPDVDKMYAKEYHANGNLKAEGWVQNDTKINFWRF